MSGAGGAAPGGQDDGYAGTPFRAAHKEPLLVRDRFHPTVRAAVSASATPAAS